MVTAAEHRRDTLAACFSRLFGRADDRLVDAALPLLRWISVPGGAMLMKEGEPPDGVYFVIRGRLRAWVERRGERVLVGDIGRGETVGEMGVITGAPRSATVVAVRDTLLAYADPSAFDALLHRGPELPIRMAKIVIERLQAAARPSATKPATVCLLAISGGASASAFAPEFAAALGRWGTTHVESGASIDSRFGPGSSAATHRDAEADDRVTGWLENVEGANDFLLLVADDRDSEWTRRCLRQSDEVLLIGDGSASPDPGPVERTLLSPADAITEAHQRLVLLHDDDRARPFDTPSWLAGRAVQEHVHVRSGDARDLARLARIVTGNAIGLVLGGGGARGFAHLGVYRALREAGIAIDYVGGTSIGGIMAAWVAADLGVEETIRRARDSFAGNPTGDLNILPMVSLIRGKRLKERLARGVRVMQGSDMTDTWLTLYCVAASYSTAREVVLTRGPLDRALRASVSIPAALPPVPWDGELLIDGGVFNNFPTDVMARMGARKIIGVEVGGRQPSEPFDHDEIPGTWQLLRDRLRGRARRYSVPSLGALLVGTTLLYSESRREAARVSTDIYIQPELDGFGLLDWGEFDRIVEIGYRQARKVLDAMTAEALEPYRDATPQLVWSY